MTVNTNADAVQIGSLALTLRNLCNVFRGACFYQAYLLWETGITQCE